MALATFIELYDAVMTCTQRGAFAEAHALLRAEGGRFPDDAAAVLYLRSCMAARVGDGAAALAALGEALDHGHWYGERLLRESPSWRSLQGDPAFERLAARSLARMAAAPAEPAPLLALPAGVPPPRGWPLILALHGDGGNARQSLEGWRPAARGRLLAALESSQALGSQMYVWDDHDRARADVLAQLVMVRAAHPVDGARVVLGGFGRGAETALQLALAGALTAQGVVLFAPDGPLTRDPERWLPLIGRAAHRGLQAAVVVGAEDGTDLIDSALQLAPLLDDNGVPCYLEVVQGLGHAYPRDGGGALHNALEFATGW